MNRSKESLAPWNDPDASSWLTNLESWKTVSRMVEKTLVLEPTQFPHRIRAAAAMVIMFGRPGVWPVDGVRELDRIVDLARRQLVLVKSYFTSEARARGNMLSNPTFRKLMQSIDEEVRILESRISDPPLNIPQTPPGTWGDFWQI